MPPRSIADIQWQGKIALVRADLNAPLTRVNGKFQIANDSRIRAVLPTLQLIAQNAAKIVLLSHLGRPNGKHNPELSLAPVAAALQNALGQPVSFSPTHPPTPPSFTRPPENSPTFHLMENTRFHLGEAENSVELAKQFAQMGDVFVMDAFACAHRAEASVCQLANQTPEKCVGLLVQKEISALNHALHNPLQPVVGVFGGAKISDKIPVIRNLARHMDSVLVGGGAANTLLLAQNKNIGKSIAQRDNLQSAQELLALGNVHLPVDAVVAPDLQNEAAAKNLSVSEIPSDQMILDIGAQTRKHFAEVIQSARTIIWNGPMGVFETAAFSAGTEAVAKAVAESDAFSLAGGGETLAAIAKFGVGDGISHVSTGGGALLEYMSGSKLPGLAAVGAQ